MLDPKGIRYATLTFKSKKKRIRKKAWHRLLAICGEDREGLVNYAKAHRYMETAKNI